MIQFHRTRVIKISTFVLSGQFICILFDYHSFFQLAVSRFSQCVLNRTDGIKFFYHKVLK